MKPELSTLESAGLLLNDFLERSQWEAPYGLGYKVRLRVQPLDGSRTVKGYQYCDVTTQQITGCCVELITDEAIQARAMWEPAAKNQDPDMDQVLLNALKEALGIFKDEAG